MTGPVLALGLFQSLVLLGAPAPLEVKGTTARLIYIKGKVEILPAGGKAWVSASNRRQVAGGEHVRTKERSLAEVLLENGSVLRMAPSTELIIKEAGVGEKLVTSVRLSVGQFWSNVSRLTRRGSKFEVETESATIGVRGTVFNTGVDEDEDMRVQVYEGRVEVWNPIQEVDPNASNEAIEAPGEVSPGFKEISREAWTIMLDVNQELQVDKSGEHKQATIDPKEEAAQDSWVKFNQDRDRLLAKSKDDYLKGILAVPDAEIPVEKPEDIAPATELP